MKFPILLIVATLLAGLGEAAMPAPNGPYTVNGNVVKDKSGQTHIFRGFSRPSHEWNPAGQFISLSDFQAQSGLGANIVRFSLNQNYWLSGANGYDANYKTNLDQHIAWAKTASLDIILDLHWSTQGSISQPASQQNMADANSITFWTQVATAYANDPAILFELYNEPHDVSCDVWRNGGSAGSFTAAGMQQMYDAVRATGANNLVIVNGLNWGFDLSCVKQGFAITGTNIMYCTHVYFSFGGKQTKADWDAAFGYLAPTYPLIATEFGNYDCSTPGYTSYLDYMDTLAMSFTAWAWWVQNCGFPSLITDWTNPASSLTAPGQLVAAKFGGTVSPVPTGTFVTTTPGPTGATTTAAPTSPATCTQEKVYDKGPVWDTWGWDTTINQQDTAVLYTDGGPAVSWRASQFNGIYYHTKLSTTFLAGTFVGGALEFWVNGGSGGGQQQRVGLYWADNFAGNHVQIESYTGGSIPTNTWTRVRVPMADFAVGTAQQFNGVVFQSYSGSATLQNTLYYANISFVCGPSSATTTSASTTSPSGTTTKATTAAPGSTTTVPGTTASVPGSTTTAPASTTPKPTSLAARAIEMSVVTVLVVSALFILV